MRWSFAVVPNVFLKFTVAEIAFVEIQPLSDVPEILADILSVSGTNSATWNVVCPSMSCGFARTFNEYIRMLYSPIGAVVDIGIVKSNKPSDCNEMFFLVCVGIFLDFNLYLLSPKLRVWLHTSERVVSEGEVW